MKTLITKNKDNEISIQPFCLKIIHLKKAKKPITYV